MLKLRWLLAMEELWSEVQPDAKFLTKDAIA
jgi:hypothetical protein